MPALTTTNTPAGESQEIVSIASLSAEFEQMLAEAVKLYEAGDEQAAFVLADKLTQLQGGRQMALRLTRCVWRGGSKRLNSV